jgi:hypothetical protein
MATIKGTSVKVTYNGAKIQQFFADNGINVAEQLAQLPVYEFTVNLRFVAVRIASRQFCLWKHSFDWRNRKRGHPVHRRTN